MGCSFIIALLVLLSGVNSINVVAAPQGPAGAEPGSMQEPYQVTISQFTCGESRYVDGQFQQDFNLILTASDPVAPDYFGTTGAMPNSTTFFFASSSPVISSSYAGTITTTFFSGNPSAGPLQYYFAAGIFGAPGTDARAQATALVTCQVPLQAAEPTATTAPTETPEPTATIAPTETIEPTATITPTETQEPTATTEPSPTESTIPTATTQPQPGATVVATTGPFATATVAAATAEPTAPAGNAVDQETPTASAADLGVTHLPSTGAASPSASSGSAWLVVMLMSSVSLVVALTLRLKLKHRGMIRS
jgi:hypothetical protein